MGKGWCLSLIFSILVGALYQYIFHSICRAWNCINTGSTLAFVLAWALDFIFSGGSFAFITLSRLLNYVEIFGNIIIIIKAAVLGGDHR